VSTEPASDAFIELAIAIAFLVIVGLTVLALIGG